MLTNNEIFVFVIYYNYNIIHLQFVFSVDSKMNSNKKECTNLRGQMVYRWTLHVKQPDIASDTWPEAINPWKF